MMDRATGAIARAARRGSIVVMLSDLLDLPEDAAERVAAIAARGRVVVVVQALDPDEATFPFEETVRLRSLEGNVVVETDAEAKARYLAALGELGDAWERALVARGGRLVRAVTSDDPVRIVRQVVEAVR
jgi:dienelactone hydrolase